MLRSAALVLSAAAFVIVLGMPDIGQRFPFWVINTAGYFADTIFHEMGHAVFAWAFGYPSIPAVFTLFGTDQAAGVALTFDHSWFVQVMVWISMGYGVWWLWREGFKEWARIAAAICAALFILSFWQHHVLVGLYMGHGSAILMGCFFLYRGLLDLAARSAYERWLNLFLGFFMLYRNAGFAWLLAFDQDARAEYSELKIFGASHHDFMAMHEELFALSVQDVAQATVIFIAVAALSTFALAYIRRYDYGDF
jgi:hypothetical protein